jgi:hypothetical protein
MRERTRTQGAASSSSPRPERTRIDGPFAIVTQEDLSIVVWGTVPLYHFRNDDKMGRHAAAVELVRFHHLGPEVVAEALKMSRRTMYRVLERFDEGGLGGLVGQKRGGPAGKSRKVEPRKASARRQLRGAGHRGAARRSLKEAPAVAPDSPQPSLPAEGESPPAGDPFPHLPDRGEAGEPTPAGQGGFSPSGRR